MIETSRLTLDHLSYDHCEFIIELLNEPSFIKYIGDKGVRTADNAREYLRDGPIGSYEQHGYGLYVVSLREDDMPLGICGLVKRDEFDDPDLGFAFLRRYWSQGYAMESAAAALDHGRNVLGLTRIIALVDGDNEKSVRLLEKLGMSYESMVRMPDDDHDICLYVIES